MNTLGARVITTPAGVRIGSAFTPKPAPMDRDARAVQAALLDPRTASPLPSTLRLFGAIWRLL